jgi:serine/threonine-protein kinase
VPSNRSRLASSGDDDVDDYDDDVDDEYDDDDYDDDDEYDDDDRFSSRRSRGSPDCSSSY